MTKIHVHAIGYDTPMTCSSRGIVCLSSTAAHIIIESCFEPNHPCLYSRIVNFCLKLIFQY